MKLAELLVNQNIIVQLIWNEKKMEFFADIVEKDDKVIYVTPYMTEGKEVEINVTCDKAVICNIFADDLTNDQRISWRNVELLTVEKNGRILYCIKTHNYNNLSNVEDRRGAERIAVTVDGEIFDVKTNENVRVLIHDISETGIAFYAPKSFIPKSQQLRIVFSDSIDDKTFDIEAVLSIARTKYMNDSAFIGCRLIGEENSRYRIYNYMKRIYSKHANKSGAAVIISQAS